MTEIKEIDDTVREEIPERIPETCKKKRRTGPVLKPRDGLMIAFFVPVLVMICIFAQRGIFPYGERCFLRTDMYHQYAPFSQNSSISCGQAEVFCTAGMWEWVLILRRFTHIISQAL